MLDCKKRPSRGIEPLPGDPQSPILTTILRRPTETNCIVLVLILAKSQIVKLTFYYILRQDRTMQGKGWFIAMAIAVAIVWAGVNYLLPWK